MRFYLYTCDRCGTESPMMKTPHESILQARSEGWHIGEKHLCPDCWNKK